MFRYLLPGSELHDKLRTNTPGIDSTVMYIYFKYSEEIPDVLKEENPITVDMNNAGDILASISEDGTRIYIYSDYDIRTKDCQMMFYRMSNLCRVDLYNFNTDECDSMRRMFMNCTSLVYVDMNNLSSSNVEDFTEMFSGCSSCQYIDIRRFKVPSTKETCVFSDMFKDTTSLRRISVGENFVFEASMSLANPNTDVIKDSNGLWNCPELATSYNADDLPTGLDTTYYAIDVNSDTLDKSLITLGSLKESTKDIALSVARQLKYLSAE